MESKNFIIWGILSSLVLKQINIGNTWAIDMNMNYLDFGNRQVHLPEQVGFQAQHVPFVNAMYLFFFLSPVVYWLSLLTIQKIYKNTELVSSSHTIN